MRTMFAVGHRTGTHTTIVIARRRREGRRTARATQENAREPRIARSEAAAKTPADGTVH